MTNQAVMSELEASCFQLTEEQQDIKQCVREFAESVIAPRSAEIDEKAKFPFDIYKEMVEQGLVALPYPEAYGGGGADPVTECILVEELSRVDLSCALACLVNTLGSKPIMLGGSEEQKQKYISRITSGESLCASITKPVRGATLWYSYPRNQKRRQIVITEQSCSSATVTLGYSNVFAKTSPERT